MQPASLSDQAPRRPRALARHAARRRWRSPHADPDVAIEEFGAALDELARVDARLAQCVDLKFFCGYSFAEIAELWAVSERTVKRDWDKARVLLHRLLGDQPAA